jgi:hypothetical protein
MICVICIYLLVPTTRAGNTDDIARLNLATNVMAMLMTSMATNGIHYVLEATNFPYGVEYMVTRGTLTNVVKQLLAEGHVCAIMGGHRWVITQAVATGPDGGYMYRRRCEICNKCEVKEPGTWK